MKFLIAALITISIAQADCGYLKKQMNYFYGEYKSSTSPQEKKMLYTIYLDYKYQYELCISK